MGKIVVTGMGIVSALGAGKEATLRQLRAGKAAIGEMKQLQSRHSQLPVAEVPFSNDELKEMLGIPVSKIINRSTLIGKLALREALSESLLTKDFQARTAFLSGNTVGGMDVSELFYHDFLTNDLHNEFIRLHDCGVCTEMIADEFSFPLQFTTTISTACSSAANTIIFGANLIKRGEIDVAVVGGTECLSKFHLNGFNSLMILDHEPCKPFDAQRNGLNLGEGAAYLVLETEEHALQRGVPVICQLSGYGNSCDAFHQTATSPNGEGPYLAMSKALKDSGLTPKDIDYINAHGTGTNNNDECEGIAMERVFGDKMPPFSSTKSYTGHTTSASGSVESVISILALKNHFIPATLRHTQTIENHHFKPVSQVIENVDLRHVLTNSFGFGGNDSSCIFSLTETAKKVPETPAVHGQAVYIQAISQISIQHPLDNAWFDQPLIPTHCYTECQEADYSKIFTPMAARRMGKLFKRAITTAVDVLQKSHHDQTDAIISGTGLGCIENTEKFLKDMLNNNEECLSPTAFMQSTHNTIASQIALHLKCHGYNNTYSHRGTSFDSSLYDALTLLQKGEINNAIVGAHEEMSPEYFKMLQKAGYFTFDDISEAQLKLHQNTGSLSGSCAVNMFVSRQKEDSHCAISFMKMFYKDSSKTLKDNLLELLSQYHLQIGDIDAVVLGLNGDKDNDAAYLDFAQVVAPSIPIVWYKHLFGESYCASALGVYVGATCLQRQTIPSHLLYNKDSAISHIKHILVYNHFENKDQSLILLSLC